MLILHWLLEIAMKTVTLTITLPKLLKYFQTFSFIGLPVHEHFETVVYNNRLYYL
jgi:hypothetical protein